MTDYQPCPKCSESKAKQVSFTWWGGLVGPKVLNHVKCGSCGAQYNGKSGKDNTTGIIIYSIVVFLIVMVLLVIAVAALIVLFTMN